jgi:hypothetical protein
MQRKSEGSIRLHMLTVRLDDEEFSELEPKVSQSGLSQSEYVRRCLREACASSNDDREVTKAGTPEFDLYAYRELLLLRTELQKQGANINQIARFVNKEQHLPDGARSQLEALQAEGVTSTP